MVIEYSLSKWEPERAASLEDWRRNTGTRAAIVKIAAMGSNAAVLEGASSEGLPPSENQGVQNMSDFALNICVNCDAEASYPHDPLCPRPMYRGEPDAGSPNHGKIVNGLQFQLAIAREEWSEALGVSNASGELADYEECRRLFKKIRELHERLEALTLT